MWKLALLLVRLSPALPGSPRAADRGGDFDYHILALSWNAAWCKAEGDARSAAQCDPRTPSNRGLGFILHGLWPQYGNGWPEYCETISGHMCRVAGVHPCCAGFRHP